MKVLMLGWEYPPHIAGGLGVACEGLTKALSEHELDIRFVVPKLLGGEQANHMHLSDSFVPTSFSQITETQTTTTHSSTQKIHHEEVGVELHPYANGPITDTDTFYATQLSEIISSDLKYSNLPLAYNEEHTDISRESKYGKNMFEEVVRYTTRVLKRYAQEDYDIIHAHDWMTYAAGIALKKMTGKPLVVHVHSLDYDRSGPSRNFLVSDIEYQGVQQADRVIAVSQYTKGVLEREYHVDSQKISVVHNGISEDPAEISKTSLPKNKKDEKTVLFLGRITVQKGPDYFIQAMAKVLKELPDVNFIMAGTGDMLPRMIELSHQLGIENNIHFTGFLSGRQIKAAFNDADVYVLPSVSEPFGISVLEAIKYDTPVLISNQSGVKEVIRNSLTFDFWDVDRLADLILNSLIYEELRGDMSEYAKTELQELHWGASAARTKSIYQSTIDQRA